MMGETVFDTKSTAGRTLSAGPAHRSSPVAGAPGPRPSATRRTAERAPGHDFAAVRVSADPRLEERRGALASRVWFSPGASPASAASAGTSAAPPAVIQLKKNAKARAREQARARARAENYEARQQQRTMDRELGRDTRVAEEFAGRDPSRLLPPDPVAPAAPVVPPLTGIALAQAKHQALGLRRISRGRKKEFARAARRDEASYRVSGTGLVLSTEGEEGPYDESFPQGQVMWRADSRPPKQVLRTGFSPKVERDLGMPRDSEGRCQPNQIVFRTGDDDIVPSTGVCVARDPRGAAFFPFESTRHTDGGEEDEASYLYAVAVRQAASTVKAQRAVEAAETGRPRRKWRRAERFGYDPQEARSDQGSAVWPYNEYVVHRVEPSQIVSAYRVNRQRLVNSGAGDDIKAGMRFQLDQRQLVRRAPRTEDERRWREQASAVASPYIREAYPRQDRHYLSYQGVVTPTTRALPTSTAAAEASVRQVRPIAAQPVELQKLARRKGKGPRKGPQSRRGLGHRSSRGRKRDNWHR